MFLKQPEGTESNVRVPDRRDMDMSWDQIATLAQLVTGAATLAVAIFVEPVEGAAPTLRETEVANETKQQDLFACGIRMSRRAIFCGRPTTPTNRYLPRRFIDSD